MLNKYLSHIIKTIFFKAFTAVILERACPLLIVRSTNVPTLLKVLKFSSLTRLNSLMELTAYDLPRSKKRFTINFFLLSIEYNFRLAINCYVALNQPLSSISHIYVNANWAEREVRDMFGIYFTNNKDLRRLLTDYGFEGFPLRKDFPLTGYYEVRYDDELQQILYEPLQLSQEFRLFTLTSPWEKKNV